MPKAKAKPTDGLSIVAVMGECLPPRFVAYRNADPMEIDEALSMAAQDCVKVLFKAPYIPPFLLAAYKAGKIPLVKGMDLDFDDDDNDFDLGEYLEEDEEDEVE